MPKSRAFTVPASGENNTLLKYGTIEAPEESPSLIVSGVYGEEGGVRVSEPQDVGGSNYRPGAVLHVSGCPCTVRCSSRSLKVEPSGAFGFRV